MIHEIFDQSTRVTLDYFFLFNSVHVLPYFPYFFSFFEACVHKLPIYVLFFTLD